jgi:hypothetical protein
MKTTRCCYLLTPPGAQSMEEKLAELKRLKDAQA